MANLQGPTRSIGGFTNSLQGLGTLGVARIIFGLHVSADDIIYVCDYVNNKIVKYTLAGVKVGEWGKFGTTNGRIDRPSVVHCYDSEVFVWDITERIQVFTESGVFIRNMGTYKFPAFYESDFYSATTVSVSYPVTYTFSKYNKSGTLLSSFSYFNLDASTINLDDGVLRVYGESLEDSGDPLSDQIHKYFAFQDDGTVIDEVNALDYPTDEWIEIIPPHTADGSSIYSIDDNIIRKHDNDGTFLDNLELTDLDFVVSTGFFSHSDGNLYLALNAATYVPETSECKMVIINQSSMTLYDDWILT